MLPADTWFAVAHIIGYEPRAVFPHPEVQYNIAVCIKELQDEERDVRYTKLQSDFKGGACIGIQLDMWTDTHTHVAYSGINAVTVREPREVVFTAGSTGTAKSPAKPLQLYAMSEVLDFDVFPLTEHTGENIKAALVATLAKKKIKHTAISGLSPDGAADGQCGLALIEDLAEKVDTCSLHRIQRGVLFSIGMAGATSKNPECKKLIKGHNREVQLSNQSRAVSDGIRKQQIDAGVPASQLLTTVDTAPTRWGNQSRQISRNCTLRPVLDPVIDEYKRNNKAHTRHTHATPTPRPRSPPPSPTIIPTLTHAHPHPHPRSPPGQEGCDR